MAFVRSIELDQELSITALNRGNEWIGRVAIGFDDVTDATYSAFCALAPEAGFGNERCELIFCVIESDGSGFETHSYFDGLQTKGFIASPTDRLLVRAVFCSIVRALIDATRPEIVSMMTHTSHLPLTALGKFFEIASVFTEKGYLAGRSDPYHGRHIWMMQRLQS